VGRMRPPRQKHSLEVFDGGLRDPQYREMRIPEIGWNQHRFPLSLLPIRQTGLIEIEDELR
jgi:imidazoleglycerol phosphate synthase glutamine amidotransferase subunit HisH